MTSPDKSIATRVMIDTLAQAPGRATLLVQYGDGKRARIELPARTRGLNKEQAQEIYRGDLHELMDALYQWMLERGDIWPTHDVAP